MTTIMNNKLIMPSLPLVAAVLGNKYGVRVIIGGSRAFTDGSNINFPSLPVLIVMKLDRSYKRLHRP